MRDRLYRIAARIYPAITRLDEIERHAAASYVIRAVVFLPISLAGIAWLIAATDLAALRANAVFLVILLGFMIVLSQLWLEMRYLTASGSYRSDRRSFWGEALWSGVLVVGPSAMWLGVIMPWLVAIPRLPLLRPVARLRQVSQSIFRMSVIIPSLVEVTIYQALGGTFPLPGLTLPAIFPAVVATLIGFSLGSLMIGASTLLNRTMVPIAQASEIDRQLYPRFFALVTLVGPLAGLVAILPAGLYSLAGPIAYFFFLAIMVGLVAIIDQLSRTVEAARQRTRELVHLEQLWEDVLQSPTDASLLPDLLRTHLPVLFPQCNVAIRLYPNRKLLNHPKKWAGPPTDLWRWEKTHAQPLVLPPGKPHPWNGAAARTGTLVVPILSARSPLPIGRIVLERSETAHTVGQLLPAAQSLAGQIAAAVASAEAYQQTLDERLRRERVTQELTFAGEIQVSLLPEQLPQFPGCDIAARLEPARETSGDFYDIIPMWDGRLGVLIADVADKGLGAALFMSLCRTLLRVYAVEFSTRHPENYAYHPERVLDTVNRWIGEETNTGLFVTTFYGIYDPRTTMLTYANAGHNPPMLYRPAAGMYRKLERTGIPVGILPDRKWERGGVEIQPGDVLVLYTDGVTEARNMKRDEYGEWRLHRAVRANLHRPAEKIAEGVLKSINRFAGEAERFDDITLIVVRWEKPEVTELSQRQTTP